ncbi:ER membrane protein DP1/Yop1 [Borealophlyctis nickersoniae]|nr:ER membrane protein DP1/Yop1 [Borealophlyctis nickersoniae]
MADKVQYYLAQLNKELNKIPVAVEIEKRTQIPKTYIASGLGLVFFSLIFFNIWGSLLTNLLGFLYPAYRSFKAIESAGTKDDTQWLTYWTVFGFLNTIEFFSDTLLYWIPFYYTFKAALVLYLFLPQFQGAAFIYTRFVRPYLVSNEKIIDGQFSSLKNKAASFASDMAQESPAAGDTGAAPKFE